MSVLLSYAPWLVFLVVTGTTDWRLGLAAGLPRSSRSSRPDPAASAC
jgi:hypothetical protein